MNNKVDPLFVIKPIGPYEPLKEEATKYFKINEFEPPKEKDLFPS